MATITELINEFETIANAQVELNTFIYSDPFHVNSFRDKQYPILLLDKHVNITELNIKSRQRVYGFHFHFYDLYDRSEVTTKTNQTKQRDIEAVAEHFVQEFRVRLKANGFPWKVDNEEELEGTWAFNKNNDQLIELSYYIQVRATGECSAGTFNY